MTKCVKLDHNTLDRVATQNETLKCIGQEGLNKTFCAGKLMFNTLNIFILYLKTKLLRWLALFIRR